MLSRVISLPFRARLAFVALIAAITIFLGLGVWMAGSLPSWSEEISIFPSTGYRVVSAGRDGVAHLAPSCMDADSPRSVITSTRPVYALCFSEKSFPVMISSYASGIPYWFSALFAPWHGYDIFLLRKLGLLIGVVEIIATFFLVRRWVDEISAACCVLVLSCHSAYLHTHALAMYYETLPWFALTLGALGCSTFAHGSSPKEQRRTAICAGFSLLVAFLANIKAVLVLAPLGVLALRARHVLPKFERWQAVVALAGAALALIPLTVFAMNDPSAGVSQQFSSRLGYLVSQFGMSTLVLEFYSTLIFGTDMGFYGDMVTGRTATPWIPAIVCMGLGLVYPTYSLVRVLRRGQGAWFAAVCAGEIWTFLFVSAFLYGQFPSANYSPISPAFGLCLGLSLGALAKRVRPVIVGALVVATLSIFCFNVVRRGDYRRHYATSTNAAAEIDAAAFLRAHAADGTAVLTASYNLAGVFQSLGGGAIHPFQVEPFVASGCASRDGADEDCLAKRWATLLEAQQLLPRPWRVVVPAIDSRVDEPASRLMESALQKAAERQGIVVTIEGRFSTWSGVEALRILRVERDKR